MAATIAGTGELDSLDSPMTTAPAFISWVGAQSSGQHQLMRAKRLRDRCLMRRWHLGRREAKYALSSKHATSSSTE